MSDWPVISSFPAIADLFILSPRWRWLVISLAVLGVVLFEVVEHLLLFDTGEFEPDFLRDVVFYGVVTAFAAGYLLNRLEQLSLASRQSSLNYDHLQKLREQLSEAQEPQEASAIYLQSVRALFPVVAAQLLLYQPDRSGLYRLAGWPQHVIGLPNLDPQQHQPGCLLHTDRPDARDVQECICASSAPGAEIARHYCYPLTAGERLVGLLYLQSSEKLALSAEQQKLMAGMAAEIIATFDRIKLQESLDQHMNSQVNIQQRIARDMHATLGHNLAYLRMKLAQLATDNRYSTDPELRELSKLQDTADETYQQMRDLLIALTPEQTPNLRSTMSKYAYRVAERAGFELDIRYSGESRQLPAHILQQVILILREVLGNIEKHARARSVTIMIRWQHDGLVIEASDDGRGFDASQSLATGQLGLRFMHQRAREVGGMLTVSSKPGAGTHVALWVPYVEEPLGGTNGQSD